ncbi:hypothetical protein QJS04_geneDACA001470 [Acorus gramineus]|uniref:Uncharacterized protein n=1 Tax=Acorus gramineus TaxID=55184 RepID=A0AAV9A6K5_ACOGR|nr:hypothetical protein QJS04_geneDACA001470 [Acorus gramineus]
MGSSTKISSSSTAAALLLLIALFLVSGLPLGAEAAPLTHYPEPQDKIDWWPWSNCFPLCALKKDCFFNIYRLCRDETQYRMTVCVIIALDWCDINHFHNNSLDDNGMYVFCLNSVYVISNNDMVRSVRTTHIPYLSRYICR